MFYSIRTGKAKSMFKALVRRSPFCRDTRGSSAVEFALVAPVLFMLMLGIVDFGRLLWMYSTVEHAATSSARHAGVRGEGSYLNPTAADLEIEIIGVAKGSATGIAPADLTVTVTWVEANGNPPAAGTVASSGGKVTVVTKYNFRFVLIGFLPIDPFDLESTSTVLIA